MSSPKKTVKQNPKKNTTKQPIKEEVPVFCMFFLVPPSTPRPRQPNAVEEKLKPLLRRQEELSLTPLVPDKYQIPPSLSLAHLIQDSMSQSATEYATIAYCVAAVQKMLERSYEDYKPQRTPLMFAAWIARRLVPTPPDLLANIKDYVPQFIEDISASKTSKVKISEEDDLKALLEEVFAKYGFTYTPDVLSKYQACKTQPKYRGKNRYQKMCLFAQEWFVAEEQDEEPASPEKLLRQVCDEAGVEYTSESLREYQAKQKTYPDDKTLYQLMWLFAEEKLLREILGESNIPYTPELQSEFNKRKTDASYAALDRFEKMYRFAEEKTLQLRRERGAASEPKKTKTRRPRSFYDTLLEDFCSTMNVPYDTDGTYKAFLEWEKVNPPAFDTTNTIINFVESVAKSLREAEAAHPAAAASTAKPQPQPTPYTEEQKREEELLKKVFEKKGLVFASDTLENYYTWKVVYGSQGNNRYHRMCIYADTVAAELHA